MDSVYVTNMVDLADLIQYVKTLCYLVVICIALLILRGA